MLIPAAIMYSLFLGSSGQLDEGNYYAYRVFTAWCEIVFYIFFLVLEIYGRLLLALIVFECIVVCLIIQQGEAVTMQRLY